MELEQQLVRILQSLALDAVPSRAITCLFDTGGTASRREDWAEHVSLRPLRALDRIFLTYRRLYETSSGHAGVDAQVAHFWHFLASPDALETVTPHLASNQDALYRSLLTYLHSIVTVPDNYASRAEADKRHVLVHAIVASKVYLTWLQLPGGSAYGLFMPYVYRQVLEILKKWRLWMECALEHGNATDGPPPTARARKQRSRRRRQRGKRKGSDVSSDDAKDDARTVTSEMASTLGFELLELVVAFLGTFSLSSSEESIVPTIETAMALQTARLPEQDDVATAITTKTVQLVEALMNGIHGDVLHLAKVIVHCYLPGVTFHERVAKENRAALRFHRLSIDVITRMQQLAATACRHAADDATTSTRRDYSLLVLGLVQNICLQSPGLADERQRVVSYLVSTVVDGRRAPIDDDAAEQAFRDEECVRLTRFLISCARSAKLKDRHFAVEVLSRFLVDASCWNVDENRVPDALRPYAGVRPLLDVLMDRVCDKMAQVRTKAIAGITAMLTLVFSKLASRGDLEPMHDEVDGFQLLASSVEQLLYDVAVDAEGQSTRQETPLMQRLVCLFRERLVDDKTFVRRAAVHALETLVTAHRGDTVKTRCHLMDVHSRCADTSVVVRVQAIKSLSTIVLTFARDPEAQKLWNLGVLPLCMDPETTVQSCALEATGDVVFARLRTWYHGRTKPSEQHAHESVWMQVSHLDGVLARCIQKAMRLLLKSGHLSARDLIQVCVAAISESVRGARSSQEEAAASDGRWTSYWSFSWILLEELAHAGELTQAGNGKHEHWSLVVECWTKLQAQALPVDFTDGAKRILRVLTALSPVLDAHDAKAIADGILASLHAFAMPLNVIRDAIEALRSIGQANAPSLERGRELTLAWGTKLLDVCESNLRQCLSRARLANDTAWIQQQLITIGDVALLAFEKEADKHTDVALVPVSRTLSSLVQLFLPPQVVAEPTNDTDAAAVVPLPTPVRVCAVVTLGKFCLRDSALTSQCLSLLIRELRTCAAHELRATILLVLGDLCIRYPSLVDAYLSTMALSLVDASALVRRTALLLFAQLVLQDYIKWRDTLQRLFFRVVVDDDAEVATLARYVLAGPLRQKTPYLFPNKLIDMVFVLNGVAGAQGQYLDPGDADGSALALASLVGAAAAPRRAALYRFFLTHVSEEQKVQLRLRLCTDVLEEVMDGTLALCRHPSDASDGGTEAVLKDTLALLRSPAMQGTGRPDDASDASDDDDETPRGGKKLATQLAAAKGKLLARMSKTTFLEHMVPVVIGLKHTLEARRSPLTRDLLAYMRLLFTLYRDDVRAIVEATDPQLAMEVEYDVRELERQQPPRAIEDADDARRDKDKATTSRSHAAAPAAGRSKRRKRT
ncbi:hypothetical protein PsorP6_016418 [Peronosclerospora sorghi]|uniref:Uncharacterized protein n=1 Tax=Peronosclerospora sorghi TaxID=230839 RepID=A0ACC0VSA1_9STRA|nr:hypothetical protein PsorP6_016418 [Peronosclerospora sorghi]